MKTIGWDDYYEPTPWGFGSAHSISSDAPESDVIADLHKVVEEVTGKPVQKPEPRRMGFV